jgi:predicted DsbA family dithiol-disulfide isomerase
MNPVKTGILFSLFFIIFCHTTVSAASGDISPSTGLEWKPQVQWQLPSPPVDIVHSLDGKYVFILAQDHKVYIYTSAGKLEGSIPVEKGVTAIDIAPRAESLYLIDKEKNSFTSISIDFIRDINTAGSPFLGPENAPVTIALFTDFECPYCRKIEPLIAEVHKRNPEKVKIVFKNMPLQFHKFADPAARAALAAGKQGKFWEFHDELFAAEKLNHQVIEETAVKLKLDLEKWKKDMSSQEIRKMIYADMRDAEKAGVTGTPTIFVNGRLLVNRSLQGFQQLIDKELQQ